jgi:hypothetical protein
VIAAIFIWVAHLNAPVHLPWFADDWPWLAATLALSAAVPIAWPKAFETHRSLKLFLAALVVPLVFYIKGFVT